MKPAPFTYVRPKTLHEALAYLSDDGEAKLLAGGQSLVPLLNMRLVRPTTLVDINALPGLGAIRRTDGGAGVIGALVRQTDLLASPLVRERAPLLAAAAAHVGHRAIRNRGTVGGSLAHADPAAELCAAAMALEARLIIAGPAGRRTMQARDFFVGPLVTALEPREILTEIEIPPPVERGWGFAEMSRRAGDFAIAGVAGVVTAAGRGLSASSRLVAFGAADTPLRLRAAEAVLAGRPIDAALARAAGQAAAEECSPRDDVQATADYRRHLVSVLTEQVVLEGAARLAS